jgi:hypothetical protein
MPRHHATVLLAALVLGGCASVKQEFPEHDAARVWNAMVVAAEEPRYDDWTVRNNYVLVDDPDRCIVIDRRLERTEHPPGGKPWVEKHHWQFTVRLVKTDPPTAKFIIRSLAVPVHAKAEARRYFDEVLDRLVEATSSLDEGAWSTPQ